MDSLRLRDVSKALTEDILQNAFKLMTRSEDSIFSTTITRAAPAGEGLIGAVYRVQVSGEHHKTSFVVKSLVKDLLLRKSLECTRYFAREALFFAEVLPVLIEVQNLLGAKESLQNNIPKCYGYHCDGDNDFILMEDLLQQGCQPVSSDNPTEAQRNKCLEVLAHLHAVSMAARLKKYETFSKMTSKFSEAYYTEDRYNLYIKYLESAIEIDKQVIRELESPTSLYYKKFFELIEKDPYNQMMSLVTSHSDYSVINHGDAWCPNFFCNSDKAVVFDFQIFRVASPATDLYYFLCMCVNSNTTKEYFMDAINVYYSAIEYYLKDMNLNASEVFPRSALDAECKRFGKFGVLAALSSIPLIASDKCDVLESFESKFREFEKIPLELLWKLTPFKNEEQKRRFLNMIHIVVDVGLI